MNALKSVILALVVCAVLLPGGAEAQSRGLNVDQWLRRPGVRLLAVEFYATWCKPCMAAVPHWKRLHEKYADEGLRLVVVATRDANGQCINPGWNPDDMVCDIDGRLADAMNVGNALPAAFLWNWRGDLLVRKGHVKEVSRAVARELRDLPRIAIDPPSSGPNQRRLKNLQAFVETKLSETDKVTVVAGKSARRALAKARKKSHGLAYSDASRCRLGEALAANSVLRMNLIKVSGKQHLNLQLFSAEKACLVAASMARLNLRRPQVSAAEAVAGLIDNLRVPLQMPGAPAAYQPAPSAGDWKSSGDWKSDEELVSAGFGAGLAAPSQTGTTQALVDVGLPEVKGKPDFKLLDLLQSARKAEKGSAMDEKAKTWEAVADYRKAPRKLKLQARERAKGWRALLESEAAEQRRIDEIRERYAEDQAQLQKYLSYDDEVVSPAQKQAYREEFQQAYADWTHILDGGIGSGSWLEVRKLLMTPGTSLKLRHNTVHGFLKGADPSDPARPAALRALSDVREAQWTKQRYFHLSLNAGTNSSFGPVIKVGGYRWRRAFLNPFVFAGTFGDNSVLAAQGGAEAGFRIPLGNDYGQELRIGGLLAFGGVEDGTEYSDTLGFGVNPVVEVVLLPLSRVSFVFGARLMIPALMVVSDDEYCRDEDHDEIDCVGASSTRIILSAGLEI